MLQDFFYFPTLKFVMVHLEKKIIIAIDGYSACGKSTLAKDLARRLSYIYIDSGAMYRAVTYWVIQHNVDLKDSLAIEHALSQIHISFQQVSGHNTIFLNQQNIESEIRTMEVNQLVSPVAAISSIRRAMVKQQQLIGSQKGIVMDGRDIGTVVFPNAELKIFLTADVEIRTIRRWQELTNRGFDISKSEVKENLEERDRIDTSRSDSPLMKATDAIEINNSNLTREQQADLVYQLSRERIFEAT
jgi:cytidylate kinase